MEPVVSPWLIYLIGVCDKLDGAMAVVCIVLGMIILFLPVLCLELGIRYKPIIVCCFALLIVSFLLMVLVPTKEIAIAMAVSHYITPDNIVGTEDHIIEFIRKVAKAVK